MKPATVEQLHGLGHGLGGADLDVSESHVWVSGLWVSAEYPQFARLQAHGNTHKRTLADGISLIFACFSDAYGREWMSEEEEVVPRKGFEPPTPSLRMTCSTG